MRYDTDFLDLLITQDGEDPEAWTREWLLEWFVGAPLRIVGLIFAGWLIRLVAHRAIDRIVATTVPAKGPRRWFRSRRAAKLLGEPPVYSERRALRAQTLGSLLKSVVTFVIAAVVTLMVLSEFYNIGPLLASAGIAGIALGFGAQNLVKDFISGVFMLLEDQYGVGDVIDMGEASGVVEDVGLRVTRIRDVDGTVWYVRNGEVLRVGNKSQGWARAVIDVGVAYSEDTRRVRQLLEETAHELFGDPDWAEFVLDEPEVWGVEQLAADSVVIRVVVKTRPLQQWKVARELRERIKRRFDAEGIEIPFPQRTVWVREDVEQPESAVRQQPGSPAKSGD